MILRLETCCKGSPSVTAGPKYVMPLMIKCANTDPPRRIARMGEIVIRPAPASMKGAKRAGAPAFGRSDGTQPRLPEFMREATELHANSDGEIAIVRRRVCVRTPEWRAPGTGEPPPRDQPTCPVVERFDSNGRRLPPFSLNRSARLMALRADTVWTVEPEIPAERGATPDFRWIIEYVIRS